MSKGQSAMPPFRFKLGMKVDLLISAGLYKGHYPSRLEDLKDNNQIGLAHPFMRGVLLPVYRDMRFAMVVEDSTAVYEYQMSVVRVDLKSGFAILWATIEAGPERIQRRRFLRVESFWQTKLFLLEQETETPMQGRWIDVRVIDISLGGYRFKASFDAELNEGDRLLLDFVLAGKRLFLEGRAVRIGHNEKNWDVGVEFDALPGIAEKTLFAYIRQQEMIGRGKNAEG